MVLRRLIGFISSLTLAATVFAADSAPDVTAIRQQNDADVSNPAEDCSKAGADIKSIADTIEKQADGNMALDQIHANFALLKGVAVRCGAQQNKSESEHAKDESQAQNVSTSKQDAGCQKQLRDIGERVDQVTKLIDDARRNENAVNKKDVLQQAESRKWRRNSKQINQTTHRLDTKRPRPAHRSRYKQSKNNKSVLESGACAALFIPQDSYGDFLH
jgi:hypothetical protein